MTSPKTENCMVCGERLEYLEAARDLECTYCGKLHKAHVRCPGGHCVCDECHGRGGRKAIEDAVLAARSQDPVEVAELMMAHPVLPMLSCDHAFIAAGALLAALRNTPYGSKIGEGEVREAFDRIAKQSFGGSCGLTGVCGIAPAAGAVVSLFVGARCGTDREQKFTMEAVTRVCGAMTELTGPSCCKAYVRAAVAEMVTFFAERFGVVLPAGRQTIICAHAEKHPHGCREEKCPYYRKPSRDIFAEAKFIPGLTSCVT
jgi:hypothetical protein